MPQLSRQSGTSLSEINIVPFVDVMLVLLVIFMITAPILQSGIEVDVPKTKTVKEISESRVVVSIDRAQRIYIGDDAVNIHELGDKVHAQLKNPQGDAVYLRCDKTVPFGAFALVVDTMRQSGINNISVVTEPLDDAASLIMAYASQHPGSNTPNLKKPFVWSVVFHGLLFGSLAVSNIYSHRGDSWGSTGGGGAVSVGLVAKLPGIMLPRPDIVTQSQTVDTTKGLYKAEPKPVPKEDPNVTKIPEFAKEKPPKIISRPSKVFEDKTPPPPNAVPYGQGGSPALPYSSFAMSGPTQGGMGFSGPGGGDFAGKFPSYVDAVRNRISSNWLQSTVDPSVRWAPRADFQFTVLRDGTVTNVQMLQTSGNRSVDNSALRAIQSSSPMSPLPSNYSGNSVTVEFWFDFRR